MNKNAQLHCKGVLKSRSPGSKLWLSAGVLGNLYLQEQQLHILTSLSLLPSSLSAVTAPSFSIYVVTYSLEPGL